MIKVNKQRSGSWCFTRGFARTLGTGISAAVAFGAMFALAPTAAAADSGSCTDWWQKDSMIGANVHLRTGPSSQSTSKGIVTDGTTTYLACFAKGYGYVKVLEGQNKGKKGWIHSDYLGGIFNPLERNESQV